MKAIDHYNAGLYNYILNTKNKNTQVAYNHFEEAANLGYADAYYFLGRFYGLGDGVSLNQEKAMEYFQKGASLGSKKCSFQIGLMYELGSGREKDSDTASNLFKENYINLMKEAQNNDPVSIHIIGTYYYYGFFVQRYIFSAIEWFLKSAELGYSDSQYMLGMIYETIGEKEQTDKAEKYYQLAAKQSHPYALFALGVNRLEENLYSDAVFYLEKAAKQNYTLAQYTLGYYYHDKEPKKRKDAFDWFLLAAKQGHIEAEYYVGLYYHFGYGVTKNLEKAIDWYEKAALKKDKSALYHLAMILINEENKDMKVIKKLLEQAASLDHPNAQYNLGVIYHKGDGVEQNINRAFFWYEKAAKANLAIAQYNLGMLYYEGVAVEKSEEKALEYWKKAAEQGLDAAIKLVNSIKNYEALQKSPWSQ